MSVPLFLCQQMTLLICININRKGGQGKSCGPNRWSREHRLTTTMSREVNSKRQNAFSASSCSKSPARPLVECTMLLYISIHVIVVWSREARAAKTPAPSQPCWFVAGLRARKEPMWSEPETANGLWLGQHARWSSRGPRRAPFGGDLGEVFSGRSAGDCMRLWATIDNRQSIFETRSTSETETVTESKAIQY